MSTWIAEKIYLSRHSAERNRLFRMIPSCTSDISGNGKNSDQIQSIESRNEIPEFGSSLVESVIAFERCDIQIFR